MDEALGPSASAVGLLSPPPSSVSTPPSSTVQSLLAGPGRGGKHASTTEDERWICVPGLFNLGNSCFVNAVVQVLASCAHIVRFAERSGGPAGPAECDALVHELASTLQRLQGVRTVRAPATLNIMQLLRHVGRLAPGFESRFRQQDADELLHLLLEECDKAAQRRWQGEVRASVLRTLVSSDDAGLRRPANPMQGTILSQSACLRCKSVGPLQGSVFRVLQLSLVHPSGRGVLGTLEHALSCFVLPETVDDVECEGPCRSKQRALRRCSLGRMPPCLCLHLSRRHYDAASGRIIKLGHAVAFPVRLHLADFSFHKLDLGVIDAREAATSAQPPQLPPPEKKQEQEHEQEQEQEQEQDPAEEALAWVRRRRREYSLKGVVVHRGGAEGGHFTAFRRLGSGEADWVHVSDESVTRVSLAQVLGAQAYMLFYEQG